MTNTDWIFILIFLLIIAILVGFLFFYWSRDVIREREALREQRNQIIDEKDALIRYYTTNYYLVPKPGCALLDLAKEVVASQDKAATEPPEVWAKRLADEIVDDAEKHKAVDNAGFRVGCRWP